MQLTSHPVDRGGETLQSSPLKGPPCRLTVVHHRKPERLRVGDVEAGADNWGDEGSKDPPDEEGDLLLSRAVRACWVTAHLPAQQEAWLPTCAVTGCTAVRLFAVAECVVSTMPVAGWVC